FPFRVTSTDYVSMTCNRDVKTQPVGNLVITSAPEATLNLRLADGAFPISLKGYTSSPLDAIRDELATLRDDLQTQLARINNDLVAERVEPNRGVPRDFPDGGWTGKDSGDIPDSDKYAFCTVSGTWITSDATFPVGRCELYQSNRKWGIR